MRRPLYCRGLKTHALTFCCRRLFAASVTKLLAALSCKLACLSQHWPPYCWGNPEMRICIFKVWCLLIIWWCHWGSPCVADQRLAPLIVQDSVKTYSEAPVLQSMVSTFKWSASTCIHRHGYCIRMPSALWVLVCTQNLDLMNHCNLCLFPCLGNVNDTNSRLHWLQGHNPLPQAQASSSVTRCSSVTRQREAL